MTTHFDRNSLIPPAPDHKRLWACLVPAMLLPAVSSLIYFVWLGDHPAARVIYGATKVFTVVWPAIAVYLIERAARPSLGLDVSRHVKALPLGLLTGLLIGGTILGVTAWTPLGDFARSHADGIVAKVRDLGLDRPAVFVGFGVFIAAVLALIEEWFWRWYVFGRLTRAVAPIVAYPLGGLAFAAHHYVVLSRFFPIGATMAFGTLVGVGGMIWSGLMRRSGSLAGAWLSHALVDAAIFTVGYQLVFGR